MGTHKPGGRCAWTFNVERNAALVLFVVGYLLFESNVTVLAVVGWALPTYL